VLQLPSLVSGLVVTPSGGNNIYMRGIGSASTGFNEAQVAMYIDGLYLANPTAGITSFNNIDRIEVLKGPQGTLYGRNAAAADLGHHPRSGREDQAGCLDRLCQLQHGDGAIVCLHAAHRQSGLQRRRLSPEAERWLEHQHLQWS
jgi:hypothetical protein